MSRRGFVSACTLLVGGKAAPAAQMSPAMPLTQAPAEEKERGISDEVLEMPLVLLRCTVLFLMLQHSHYARPAPRILTGVHGVPQELREKLEYDITNNQFMVTGTLTRSLYAEVLPCRMSASVLFCRFPLSLLSLLQVLAFSDATLVSVLGFLLFIPRVKRLFIANVKGTFSSMSESYQSDLVCVDVLLVRTQECMFTDEIDTYTLDKWIKGTALLFKNDYSKVLTLYPNP